MSGRPRCLRGPAWQLSACGRAEGEGTAAGGGGCPPPPGAAPENRQPAAGAKTCSGATEWTSRVRFVVPGVRPGPVWPMGRPMGRAGFRLGSDGQLVPLLPAFSPGPESRPAGRQTPALGTAAAVGAAVRRVTRQSRGRSGTAPTEPARRPGGSATPCVPVKAVSPAGPAKAEWPAGPGPGQTPQPSEPGGGALSPAARLPRVQRRGQQGPKRRRDRHV